MLDVESILHATRERARSLARARIFSAAVVVCFALAAGANATMLGLAERAFFWRPPGVAEPSTLDRVWVRLERPGRPGEYRADVGYPYVAALAARRPGTVAGYAVNDLEMRASGDAELRRVALTTADYFTVLGAHARVGRTLSPRDTVERDGEPPAVLGHAASARMFGGDGAAIGRRIEIAGRSYVVVGVMPERFSGAEPQPVDAWIPVGAAADAVWGRGWESGAATSWMRAIVRQRGGRDGRVAREGAMNAAAPRTEIDALKRQTPRFQLRRMFGEASPDAAGEARLSLWLLAMAVVVLAIAGVNVVSLFGSRAAHRAGELALRSALGASRRRLVLDAAIEAALLAAVAMALTSAALVAADAWLGRQLTLVVGEEPLVSATSLGVCAAVLVLLSVVCGVVPMLRRAPGSAFMRETSARSPGSSGAGRALLIAQVTAAVLLAGEACLFAASLRNVSGLSMGIALDQLVVVTARVPDQERERPATPESFDELRRSIAGLFPGAQVAAAAGGPFGAARGLQTRLPGMPFAGFVDEATGSPQMYAVEPSFFGTMGMHLIAGRLLDVGDGASSPHVLVVNQSLARAIGGGASPVGRCLLLGSEERCWTVVGVVADHAVHTVVEKPFMMLYLPLAQDIYYPLPMRSIFVRTRDPASTRRTLERGLAPLRGRFQQLRVEPLADIVAPQVHSWRMGTVVFVGFAVCALVLTAFGVYGTVLSQLTLRRRELAVRKALGASVGQLARAAAGPVMVAVLVGLVAGYAVAAGAGTLLASLLFGVEGARTSLLAVAMAMVALSVLAALAWPIARATGEQLLGALKEE